MQSALSSICRLACRRYSSFKIIKFPQMPCPPMEPMALPCAVANDVLPPQGQVNFCKLRTINPCAVPERPKPPKPPEEPFRSVWETWNATSVQGKCKGLLPRFDSLFYRPTYSKRSFQRTWKECPPVKQRLRKICCLDGIEPPEVIYRVKERSPKIFGIDYKQLLALCSDNELVPEPTKKGTSWPCFTPSRSKSSCKIRREKTICTKLRAPYPSFSEQYRGRISFPSSECRCHETVPRCVAMQVEIHRKNLERSPIA